jgi:DNA repair exonuclease SbcCD ATPase subunit/predicted phosphodiesterase
MGDREKDDTDVEIDTDTTNVEIDEITLSSSSSSEEDSDEDFTLSTESDSDANPIAKNKNTDKEGPTKKPRVIVVDCKPHILKELQEEKFDYIWHMADIHIHLQSRHDEYRTAFAKVFETLNQEKNSGKKGLVVICGDIVHSKCELSPEAVALVKEFFIGMPVTVICIAGNHDANLGNKDRLDALSPILDRLLMKHVYYLKHTGLYVAGNIMFGVGSVFDGYLPKLPDKKTQQSFNTKYNVMLYHGAVNGCITDVGTRLSSEKVVDDFNGWDYTLLGDIHKCQAMKMKMAYSGSLIQQGFVETGFHGYLRWELGKDEAHRVEIKNDWGWHRLLVKKGEIAGLYVGTKTGKSGHSGRLQSDRETDTTKWKISKNPRIELYYGDDTSPEALGKLAHQLRKKYSVEFLSTVPLDNDTESINNGTMDNLQKMTIGDKSLPLKLLMDFMHRREVPKEQAERIGELHLKWRKEILSKDTLQTLTGRWRPTKIWFQNMFSYKGTWSLELSDGLLGRFGPNGDGKSSTLDIILLLLFDKAIRSDKKAIHAQVVTRGEKFFKGVVEFVYAGTKYYVSREGSINRKTLSVKSHFWKVNSKGKVENLTEKDRYATNRAIEALIGTCEEAVNVGMMLQNSGTGFVDETPMRRKERINRILNLDKFDAISDMISDAKRECNATLKSYQKIDEDDKDRVNEDYDKLKEALAAIEKKLSHCQEALHKFSKATHTEGIPTTIKHPEKELAELKHKLSEKKHGRKKADLISEPLSELTSKLTRLEREYYHSKDLQDQLQQELLLPSYMDDLLKENTQEYLPILKRRLVLQKILERKLVFPVNLSITKSKYNSDMTIPKKLAYIRWAVDEQSRLAIKYDESDRLYHEAVELNSKLREHKYDPKCKFCCNNPFVKNALFAQKSIPSLENQRKENLHKLQEVEYISKLNPTAEEYRTLMNHELFSVGRKLDEERRCILEVEPIVDILREIKKRNAAKLSCHYLLKEIYATREKISILEHTTSLSEDQKRVQYLTMYLKYDMPKMLEKEQEYRKVQLQKTERLGMLKQQRQELKKKLEEAKVLQQHLDDLKVYESAMSRDGIPRDLAAKLVPRLERDINSVIGQIGNFSISIDSTTAAISINNLKGTEETLDAQMCCGSEKLIIELSLRAVIASMTAIHAPGIMILDESLNDFDATKRASLEALFHTLQRHFETILVISHQDYVKSMVGQEIVPCKGSFPWLQFLVKLKTEQKQK